MSNLFITPQLDTYISKCLYNNQDEKTLTLIGFLLSNQKYNIKYDSIKYKKDLKSKIPTKYIISDQIESLTQQALKFFELYGNDNTELYYQIGKLFVNDNMCPELKNNETIDDIKISPQLNPIFQLSPRLEDTHQIFTTFEVKKLIDENVENVKKNGLADESKCIKIGRLLTDQRIEFLKEEEVIEQKKKEEKKQQKVKELNIILKDLKLSGLNIKRINSIIENPNLRKYNKLNEFADFSEQNLRRIEKRKIQRKTIVNTDLDFIKGDFTDYFSKNTEIN
jgi:hypothetical protein